MLPLSIFLNFLTSPEKRRPDTSLSLQNKLWTADGERTEREREKAAVTAVRDLRVCVVWIRLFAGLFKAGVCGLAASVSHMGVRAGFGGGVEECL